ncbi:14578_t:CDS:2 [Funneliformis geosporum]|uniref:14578_t:CDS:1 n=1 Tax=Funneliformis geosporum TaxID=1117311 RepID=A0A9W4X0A8_9GLOM|nr:14578_t:CDS:2 [Funneliformis geosporum]
MRQYEIMDGNREDPSMTVKLMMLLKLQQNKVVEKLHGQNMITVLTNSFTTRIQEMEVELKLLLLRLLIPPNSERRRKKQLKRRNRIREMQATGFILSNSGVVSAATNSMGKCYADTVAIGNGAKKPDLISINTAWTTVASNSINIAIIALSPQPNNVTINVISSSVENIRP